MQKKSQHFYGAKGDIHIQGESSNNDILNTDSLHRDNENIDWELVLNRIKKKSNPQVFFWFSPLKLTYQTPSEVVLIANSNFDRDWINNHYANFIVENIQEIYNKKVAVKIITESDNSSDQNTKKIKR